ncbi:MAG: AbrB/MazE/SpoVT family DNA-binding domain-containing protein [Methanobacteriota archaeon]
MGINLKVDRRGRVTLPAVVRETLAARPGSEVAAEVIDEGLLLYRKVAPDEFLKEAGELQEKIKATKTAKEDALKAKEIWKARVR